MSYKDPFGDIIEVPYTFKDFIPSVKYEKEIQYLISFKGIYRVFTRSKKNLRYSCFKFKRKQQESNAYKFMNRSSIFQMRNQVQVMLKLLVWIITSNERFSTNEFVFDLRASITLSTLEDSYDSRTNHLQEGENETILI